MIRSSKRKAYIHYRNSLVCHLFVTRVKFTIPEAIRTEYYHKVSTQLHLKIKSFNVSTVVLCKYTRTRNDIIL